MYILTNPQIAMSRALLIFREHRVMRSYTSWKYETSQFKNSHDYLFGLILDHLIMRIKHRFADEVARHTTRWLAQRHKDEWPKCCSHVQAKSSIWVVEVSYLHRKPPSKSLWWSVLIVDDWWICSFSASDGPRARGTSWAIWLSMIEMKHNYCKRMPQETSFT